MFPEANCGEPPPVTVNLKVYVAPTRRLNGEVVSDLMVLLVDVPLPVATKEQVLPSASLVVMVA